MKKVGEGESQHGSYHRYTLEKAFDDTYHHPITPGKFDVASPGEGEGRSQQQQQLNSSRSHACNGCNFPQRNGMIFT